MYSDFSGNNRELLRLSAENDSLNYKDVSVLSNFISEIGVMNINESNIPISRIINIDTVKYVFP